MLTPVSTSKLVYASRRGMGYFLQRFLRLFLAEAQYLVTGIEPGPPDEDNHLPFSIASHPQDPTPGKLRDRITTSVWSAHQSLLLELGFSMRWRVDRGGDTRSYVSSTVLVDAAHGEV